MLDRVAKTAPQLDIDAKRTEALLRSRRPLLLQQEMIESLAKRIFGLVSVFVVVAAPFLSHNHFHPSGSLGEFAYQYVIGALVALSIVFVPASLPQRVYLSSGFGVAWVAVVVSAYGAGLWWIYRLGTHESVSLQLAGTAAAMLASLVICLALFGWAAVVTTWSERTMPRLWNAQHPDAAVVFELVAVSYKLVKFEPDENEDGRLKFAGRLWTRIDLAADAAQQGLPAVLSPRDPSNPETQHLALRIAAGLRNLKKSVASVVSLQSVEAKDEALRKIKSTLAAWAAGGVDDLPQSDPVPVTPKAKRLALVLRWVLAAIAPFVVLVFLRFLPFHSGELSGALTTFSILWLVSIVLRGLLGEDFEKQVKSTKEFSELTRASGKAEAK
jgi:hypothetical protein